MQDAPSFCWGRGLFNYIPLHSDGNEFGFSEHTPAGWGEAAQKAAGWGKEEKGKGGGGSQAKMEIPHSHSRALVGPGVRPAAHPSSAFLPPTTWTEHPAPAF